MTDTLTPMDHVEAIRELRARGYVVIAPDELDALTDAQHAWTCGCGTLDVLDAQARAVDPREYVRRAPIDLAKWQREFRTWAEPRTTPSAHPAFYLGNLA